jgi:hypothetical protein
MHFRCAGITETDLDARSDERPQKTFRAVHLGSASMLSTVRFMARVTPGSLARLRQTKALSPVMDLPTINVFISLVPS